MLEIKYLLGEHSTVLDLLERVETLIECFVEVVQMLLKSEEFGLLHKFDSNIVAELIEEQLSKDPQLLGAFVPKYLT